MSRSKMPAILGGCGCASLIVSMLLFAGAFLARSGADIGPVGGDTIETNVAVTKYENKPDGFTGNLAQYFVPFEFNYPQTWIVKPQDPSGPNFVSVERRNGDVTYENFNVGFFDTANGMAANEASYAQLMAGLHSQFAQQYSNLEKVSEGTTKVGSYDAYEGLFKASVNANGKDVGIFTRTILLPTPDRKKGVAIVMMGTSFAPEIKDAADLGVKGELPTVLQSFRFKE